MKYVAHEAASIFPMLDDKELQELAADIEKHGLQEPIWLDKDGKVLDGRNRLRACEIAKVPPAFRAWTGPWSPVSFVISENLLRRHLNSDQRACCANDALPLFEAEAKARQRLGKEKIPDPISSGQARDKAAAAFKTNAHYVSDAKKLKAKDPEAFEDVKKGKRRLVDVKRQSKAEKQEKERAENKAKVEASEKPEELTGTFSTIMIDPPWDFTEEGDQDVYGSTKPRYAQMREPELAALPVGLRAAQNAHLYMWITNRSLMTGKGWRLCEAWGFRPITVITWCKPAIGVGNYFRNSTEHIIFAVKGSLPLKVKNIGTWFRWGDTRRKHSEKPEETYDLVEECSPGPYLEMFARSQRKGWVSWGAEAT